MLWSTLQQAIIPAKGTTAHAAIYPHSYIGHVGVSFKAGAKPMPKVAEETKELMIWQNSKVNDSMFSVNDVVRHMMGGPEMCIECRTDDGKLWCVWVSGKLNHCGLFEERDLIRV